MAITREADCFNVFWCLAIIVILSVNVVSISADNIPFDADEIDEVMKETFQCKNNPGFAVSVVRNGEVGSRLYNKKSELLAIEYYVLDMVFFWF